MKSRPPKKRPMYAYPEKSRHGKQKWFFRIGKGKRTRLPDKFGTDEWWIAYRAALSGKVAHISPKPEKLGTLRWLIARYMESGVWAGYSEATRRQRSNIFKLIDANAGTVDLSRIDDVVIQQAIDKRAATPAQANHFLKTLRGLFSWAKRNGHVKEDPTVNVQKIEYKSSGFKKWTAGDVRQFCDYWPVGTAPRLALELYLFTGLRRGDMHLAGPQHLTGNLFSMRTEKTGEVVSMSFPDALLTTIEKTPCGAFHFMVKSDGKPFSSKNSFGNWFGDRCRDAGLELNGHGLRKLSATLLAEGGASTHELMAKYGWSNVK